MLKSRIDSTNEVVVEEFGGEMEVAQELSYPYVEALKALMKLEERGYFPLNGSGQITFHYNKDGKLSKIVPSPWVEN